MWEWSTRAHIKKNEVGGSFRVLFFLKDVPNTPADWGTSTTFVGAYDAFVSSSG